MCSSKDWTRAPVERKIQEGSNRFWGQNGWKGMTVWEIRGNEFEPLAFSLRSREVHTSSFYVQIVVESWSATCDAYDIGTVGITRHHAMRAQTPTQRIVMKPAQTMPPCSVTSSHCHTFFSLVLDNLQVRCSACVLPVADVLFFAILNSPRYNWDVLLPRLGLGPASCPNSNLTANLRLNCSCFCRTCALRSCAVVSWICTGLQVSSCSLTLL